ncbi:MAG: tetratricopeptide repeat protein [Clostridium sp.]|nr:tetratricopeptide repeat protein [Clostridium sp.]
MKKVLCSMALLIAAGAVSAQDKLVKKSRALLDESVKVVELEGGLKENTIDVEKVKEANDMLQPALTSGLTKNMAAAWDLQGDIYQRLFTVELNKAVAKQPLDTMAFAANLVACLDAYDKCYEVDAKQEYTAKNKDNECRFRPYHAYLGSFFNTNKQYKEAGEHFGKWLTYAKDHKMLENEPKILEDNSMDPNEMAYYAMMMAFQEKDYDKLLEFKDQALEYKGDGETPRKFVLQAYHEKGDMDMWVKLSKEFALNSTDEGYAQNLFAYYLNGGKKDEAVALADELLASNPDNVIANYLKGSVLLEAEKPMEALTYFEKTIELSPDYSDAYLQAGICHTREGNRINNELSGKKMTKAQNDAEIERVRDCYRKALPFVEKAMELEPDKPQRWAGIMSNIYYVLGDKAKQAEMDALVPAE